MAKHLVWIVQRDNQIRQVERTRLDFDWPHNNLKSGHVKFITRRASELRDEIWEYVYAGETREEAINYANAHLNSLIKEAEQKLKDMKARLIT